MAGKDQDFPYKKLGGRLKGMRERLSESLAEVSGAVEIEIDALQTIEEGSDRPSEDILLLLISHFAIKEDEASTLWKMAGYDSRKNEFLDLTTDDTNVFKQGVVVVPIETRILYTDMAHMIVNDHGVVLDFMQTSGQNSQPLVVSRLGMSRDHAYSLLELLQKTLNQHSQSKTKSLPAPKSDADITASEKDQTII